MSTTEALTPELQAAYRSLTKALERSTQMRLIGVRPADLRYGIEIALTSLDLLVEILIERGIILTAEEYDTRVAKALEIRAAKLEERISARLDNKKDMPL